MILKLRFSKHVNNFLAFSRFLKELKVFCFFEYSFFFLIILHISFDFRIEIWDLYLSNQSLSHKTLCFCIDLLINKNLNQFTFKWWIYKAQKVFYFKFITQIIQGLTKIFFINFLNEKSAFPFNNFSLNSFAALIEFLCSRFWM